MTKLNIAEIEENLQQLVANFKPETFIYDFLLAYGTPEANIKRIQIGNLNLSKVEGELLLSKSIFYKSVESGSAQDVMAALKADGRIKTKNIRFVMVTDFDVLLAYDTKTDDTLDIPILELPGYYDFFLPLAGMEKYQHTKETIADVRAAERMAKFYDQIKKENTIHTKEEVHNLNVFLSRLLFCYFAEDTDIFEKNIFTSSVSSHTQVDGSDLSSYLDTLFVAMNTPIKDRVSLPAYMAAFPYVNGGLFRNKHTAPAFSKRSRQMLIDGGNLAWQDINPDIFGSMIQAVITPDDRGGLGMHYTSVPNIMKVIEPLFLNELYEEFAAAKGNTKKLNALLQRIWKIKIFDPACGSGNFLIIAYKELRKLEMLIFKELGTFAFSEINLGNFYGIELDDFAHEVAILSLWLAEHQMNQQFMREFGRCKPALPLQETGNIVNGNACRIDWETVCPKNEGDEIYILGNPPYLGGKLQSAEQKQDTKIVFRGFEKYNNLDYIACWFYKAKLFISNGVNVAFVSTNSICQGTQVNDIWPYLFSNEIEIFFSHKDFPWSNNARDKAGVYCSIIGLRKKSSKPKYLFEKDLKHIASNINAYLIDAPNIFVEKRTTPLSNLPEMNQGNIPLESGHLRFTDIEKVDIVTAYPDSHKLFKKVSGSDELINSIQKWCVWILNSEKPLALSIQPIKNRIQKVIEFRKQGAENAKACLDRPHQFCMLNIAKSTQIVIPIVSSERREYIPISFVDDTYIILNSALVIYDPATYIFSLLNSKMHLLWVKVFAGRLETRIRYSVGMCWFSFPFPNISEVQKNELEQHVYKIIGERNKHTEKTLAQLYDPEKMPEGLREAHRQNDLAVERCYRSKPFESDEERLEYLFKLYEQMIEAEKESGTLFAEEKKSKKKK